MSRPKAPEPAKLFLSIIYSDPGAVKTCLQEMTDRFGPVDFSTKEAPFTATGYYNAEMGESLMRRFFTFRDLLDPGELAGIKLFTNSLEEETSAEGARRVNLDPGLLSMNNLVLATGKKVAHRPYLAGGIYADLTLIYEKGSLRALPWTYRDYAAAEMIEFLNRIRDAYKAQLKEWRAKEEDEH
jgi:hypothetical protein